MAEITEEAKERYNDVALRKRERVQKEKYIDNLDKLSQELINNPDSFEGGLCQSIKSRNHILAGELSKSYMYADLPYKIPDYNWRNTLLRYPMQFVAKIISKLSRFITVRQKEHNELTVKSLEMLQASSLDMADWSLGVDKRLKELSNLVEEQGYIIKQLYRTLYINMPDGLYLSFEEKYRGSQENIQQKQQYYMDNFIKNKVPSDSIGMAVDLGCGRGEWLSLLQKNGYNGIGVDLNEAALKCCAERNVKSVRMDAIEYLKTLPKESVKILTSFQLIEHVTISYLIELFTEISRVMRKEGIIILETPNPINVNVGAASFYLDPTHKRPIHPELLKFLAEENGLRNIEISYWQQEEINRWWDSVWKRDTTKAAESSIVNAIEDSLKKSLWSPADYAVIAWK